MTERVEREQLLQASPAEVWEAITTDGWLADEVHLELWPGGDASFRDEDEVKQGWVEEASAPNRLAFWWSAEGEPATRVELTLTPRAAGTSLRVIETRPLEILDLVGVPLPGQSGPAYGPALIAA